MNTIGLVVEMSANQPSFSDVIHCCLAQHPTVFAKGAEGVMFHHRHSRQVRQCRMRIWNPEISVSDANPLLMPPEQAAPSARKTSGFRIGAQLALHVSGMTGSSPAALCQPRMAGNGNALCISRLQSRRDDDALERASKTEARPGRGFETGGCKPQEASAAMVSSSTSKFE